ncbi:MAG: DUF3052 family protein [Candidatus Thorarchaeota archaeon]
MSIDEIDESPLNLPFIILNDVFLLSLSAPIVNYIYNLLQTLNELVVMSSTKPLPKKLFIKEGYSLLLVSEPEGYRNLLGDLPNDVTVTSTPSEPVDFIQVFVKTREELEDRLSQLKQHLKQDGSLWITYPKGTSKIKTDINRNSIWAYAKTLGLKAVHQIAVDDTWSAMRFRFA